MPPNGRTLVQRVSRHELALHPYVWLATAGTFLLLAIAVAVIAVLPLGYEPEPLYVLAGYLGVVALIFWRTDPPPVESPFNHLSLAAIYVSITFAMFAFEPKGVVAMTSAMFVGSLVPFRLIERRHIAAHNLAASLCLASPVALGFTDQATTMAVATMIPTTWVLSACVAIVLELAEAQSDELEQLARRDPLTGAGNRRMMEEHLSEELRRHERLRKPLSVLALDLDGFKALNDEIGHAAGDQLLCHVADALADASADRRGVVIRQGGDEFLVILPNTGVKDAELVAGVVRERLGEIKVHGLAISSGIGVATYPRDAVHRGVLLGVADDRLRDSKSHRNTLQALPLMPEHVRAANPVEEAPPRKLPQQSRPMSRRDIALDNRIWWITGAMFAFQVIYMAEIGANLGLLTPSLFLLGLLCLAVAIWTASGDPVPIGSWANHLLLLAMLFCILLGLTTPISGAVFGATAFVGPLIAVRLISRTQIAAYVASFVAVVFVMGALAAANLVLLVDPAIGLALITQAIVTPVLAFSCAVVLEAAEEQGRELEQIARRDALTGAGNRRMLHESLEVALSRPSGSPVGLVALDLNGFKALNDVHGHAAGDQLLREVVAAISRALGPEQTVIRLGGDEFCVVLDEASEQTLEWTEEAIRTALAGVRGPDGPISGGVGSALFPRDAQDADGLLNAADARVRATKHGGRSSPLRAVQ